MSFSVAFLPLREGENAMIGGLAPNTLKNEKGVIFGVPSFDKVDTNAIGRGPTPPNNNLCTLHTHDLKLYSNNGIGFLSLNVHD